MSTTTISYNGNDNQPEANHNVPALLRNWETVTATPSSTTLQSTAPNSRQVIDIYFAPAPDGYTVRLHSDMGAARGHLPSEISDIAAQATKPTKPTELGTVLFTTLFQGSLFARYISNRDHARLAQKELHIRMHFQETPKLAALPWEYLYDADRCSFLALSTMTPVVRFFHLAQPDPPQVVSWPLKILVVVSSPQGVPQLDTKKECQEIKQAIAEINEHYGEQVIEIECLHRATCKELQNKLREEQFHIFHFIGHSDFDEKTNEGVLIMEDKQGHRRDLSAKGLALLLQDHATLRLAVLNSCEGAKSDAGNVFAGVAQTLIHAGLPAAIAMQNKISDIAAILFAQEFYDAIADGRRVHYAVGEARKAIFVRGNQTEWATPVLFSQVEDGQIFHLPTVRGRWGS